jgi:hypothetical protein
MTLKLPARAAAIAVLVCGVALRHRQGPTITTLVPCTILGPGSFLGISGLRSIPMSSAGG